MKKFLFLGLAVGLLCLAFASRPADEPAHKPAVAQTKAEPASAEPAAPEEAMPKIQELSPAERQKAADGIAYYNLASSVLAGMPYSLPGSCHTAVHEYLRDWRLKPVARLDSAGAGSLAAAAKRLTPPQELFDEQTSAQMAQNIADMGQHLQAVLKDFRLLEKYVKDDAVVDDGVFGKKIIDRLNVSYQKFVEARDGLLKITEESSIRAEDLLLGGHPLQRQISLSREIFSLLRQSALSLGREQVDRPALEQLGGKLEATLAEAEKPPFKAPPALEREYRAFLREVKIFTQIFSAGLAGNFDVGVRQNLNAAISASRTAYNNFAAAMNGR